ncbi:MAG: phage holin family protein [Calditrichia bacterium]|nr:phage holin family protein [Calditrichia bacterium]
MGILINLLLLSLAIFIVAQVMPTIHVKSFGTAIMIAVVYSVINFLFGWILVLFTLPLVFITFGLFKFVINAFLLWVTDKLMDDFEIETFGSTLIAAFLITIVDSLLKWIF